MGEDRGWKPPNNAFPAAPYRTKAARSDGDGTLGEPTYYLVDPPERGPYTRQAIRESVKAGRIKRAAILRPIDSNESIAVGALLDGIPAVSAPREEDFREHDIQGLKSGPLHTWGPPILRTVGALALVVAGLALFMDGRPVSSLFQRA